LPVWRGNTSTSLVISGPPNAEVGCVMLASSATGSARPSSHVDAVEIQDRMDAVVLVCAHAGNIWLHSAESCR
jgi:hypothetical protein